MKGLTWSVSKVADYYLLCPCLPRLGSEVHRHRGICRLICLLLGHVIKQISLSVSSNMN